MSEINLLVFTPTWIDPLTGEDVIRPEIEAALKEQRGIDFDWHVTTENPFVIGDYRNVLYQYQQARAWFLQSTRYEALLTLEHDNLLPDPEALLRLVETPGDVIYAPYLLRHGQRLLNTWQYINDRNLGMSLSHYTAELRQARANVVHRVSGAGLGCTLIWRRVLERIEFTGATERDKNDCPDLRFAEDCLRAHFMANARFDVPVMHWDDGAGWLHPFQNRRNSMARYTALENMNAIAAGRIVRLVKNGEIELSAEEAADLTRLGVIQATLPTPAIQPDDPGRVVVDANDGVSRAEISEAARVLGEAGAEKKTRRRRVS